MPPDDLLTTTMIAIWVTILGASIGSFLNVVIARLPAGESIVRPRSRCPRCGHAIAWYDNLPIASWFALRGRCRSCQGRISFRYPLVEAAIAAAALGAYMRHGLGASAFGELVLVALLVALALIDLDTWLLPHELTAPLIAVGLTIALLGRGASPVSAALGAVVGFAALGSIWLLGEKVLHRELMGGGDAFLLAGIGAWLGVAGLLPVLLLASIQGSVFGVVQLAVGRGQRGAPPGPAAGANAPATQPEATPTIAGAPAEPEAPADAAADATWTPPRHSIPFGPFLAAGALEWLYLAPLLTDSFPALKPFA